MCSAAHVDSQCQSSWQEKPPEQVLNWIQTRSLLKKNKLALLMLTCMVAVNLIVI